MLTCPGSPRVGLGAAARLALDASILPLLLLLGPPSSKQKPDEPSPPAEVSLSCTVPLCHYHLHLTLRLPFDGKLRDCGVATTAAQVYPKAWHIAMCLTNTEPQLYRLPPHLNLCSSPQALAQRTFFQGDLPFAWSKALPTS